MGRPRRQQVRQPKTAKPVWRAVGDCPGCGKKSFRSKKAAKAAAKVHHPYDNMSAYECKSKNRRVPNPRPWHYGHLSEAIMSGDVTRDELYITGVDRAECTFRGENGMQCSLDPQHVEALTPHLAKTMMGEWVNIDPKVLTATPTTRTSPMAPAISEIARIKKSNTATATAEIDGYEHLLISVKNWLAVARSHNTALTTHDLWPRADFSKIPESERPSYDAFCSYMRHKVEQGTLYSRLETVAERKVRTGKDKVAFNRFASLFSLSATIPEVTVKFNTISPLNADQAAFLAANPTQRDRKGAAERARKLIQEPKPLSTEVPEMENTPASEPEPEKITVHAEVPAPASPASSSTDRLELLLALDQVVSLEEENARLRKALRKMNSAMKLLLS